MKLTNNLYFYPERGTLDANTYVITGTPGLIVDPGANWFVSSRVLEMREDGVEPQTIGIIANTHLHGDHCGANEAFKAMSGARITLHPVQQQHYKITVVETAQFFGLPPAAFTADGSFDGDRLYLRDTEIELIPVPGHSPDSICFYVTKSKALICGDVIFSGNVGRVDLPGGSAEKLTQGIEKLAQLDIEYLLPGHMEVIVGKDKVQHNFKLVGEMIKCL